MPPKRPTPWPWPTGWCRPPGRRGRRLRGRTGHRGRSGPWGSSSCAVSAKAGLVQDMVRTLTDTATPGWAHIVASGGTFTWGNLDAERSRSETRCPMGGAPPPWSPCKKHFWASPCKPRPRRDGLGHHHSPEGGVARGPRYGPDDRRDRSRSRGARIERSSRSPPSSRPMLRPGSHSPPRERRRCGGGGPLDRVSGVTLESFHDGAAVLGVSSGS